MEETAKYRIEVSAQANYVADQSDEEAGRFVFSYTIHLSNTGQVAAKLLSRHWVITDANHQIQEVRGDGVIGEQPTLKPGESYEYSSGTVLTTQVGTMTGSYRMRAADGTEFDAPIPQFVLSIPRVLH